MKNNKNGFTLVEIIVSLFITSILLLAISGIFPKLIDTFSEQKQNLEFQQSFVLDSFYINNSIKDSFKTIKNYSSGTFNKNNSYLTLLNKKGNYHYSFIHLGDNKGNINIKKDAKINIKNAFLYSNFTQIGNDIYFTNPGNHTIEKYSSGNLSSNVIFGTVGQYGYDNTGSGKFNTPTGITTDGINLFVSDSGNNVIRKIYLGTNQIELVCGNIQKSGYNDYETYSTGTNLTEALLDYPTGIFYDSNKLYLSDTFNNKIRKIDLSTNKIYSLVGINNKGFNFDNGLTEDIYINYPLALTKTGSLIIFSDTLNGKIRILNENSREIKTILGMETEKDIITTLSRYNKNYYISSIQNYSSGFYFNDLSKGIIYDYNFGINGTIGDEDDKIINIFGKLDENILINGNFENNITNSGVDNDIIINDNDLFYSSSSDNLSPIFGNKYLKINTIGKTASGNINFSSNPIDGDIVQIQDKIFEFDNDLNTLTDSILIPLGANSNLTLDNLLIELNNYNINYSLSGTKLNILANDIGTSGNNIIFSGSLNLSPTSGKLIGGENYSTGTFSFYFEKKLVSGKKYKLSFYIASDTNIESDVLFPLITIKTGSGNIEEKIISINDKWNKKEFIFNGTGLKEKIEILIKYGQNLYIDNMELISLDNSQDFGNLLNKQNINFGILNSFFIDNKKFFLSDFENKKLLLLDGEGNEPKSINNNLVFFDINKLNFNFKNDYLGNSFIDVLNFELNDSKSIIYNIGKKEYIIKLSNNINNDE